MIAEMVIKGANLVSMTQTVALDSAQAIAIGNGRILAVGSNDEIDPFVRPGTQVLDLSGKTVLPGFIDSHVHFMQTGLGLLGPAVYDVASVDVILEVIADVASRTPPGEVILIHGYDISIADRMVTCAELDRVAPRNPVMVGDVGGHTCIINTAAWRLLALSPELPGIKWASPGIPTGELVARANNVARYRYYDLVDESIRVAALHRAAAEAVPRGITTVHALDGGSPNRHGWLPERDIELILQEQDRLAVRTVIYFQSTDVERAVEWHLPRIGGCLYVDGAYGEHTAALLEPYADDPTTRGTLYFSDEELNAYIERAHLAGLQASMHAMGDAAIKQLLDAYELAITRHPRADHRHRIEHFSLPRPQDIERAARLGVALGMQPNFALTPEAGGDDFQSASARLLGPERFKLRHPYRKILDAGILVAGGSDCDSAPMDPLLGIHAVVNHPEEERRLTVFEALALYTINGARIAFEEKDKGTIEPGKLADLVVLADDPLTANPRTLKDIPIAMTIVGGMVKYDARSLPFSPSETGH